MFVRNCRSLMRCELWSKASHLSSLKSCAHQKRAICLTSRLSDIFKIQDEDDYREKVLQNKNVVILDFYATWCGPCKLLTPRLETIVGSKAGQLDLAKVDVDENETIAANYQVSSIPAVFAIKNGKVVDKFIGLKDDDQLRAFVGQLLNE